MPRKMISIEEAARTRSMPARTGMPAGPLGTPPPECVLIHQPGKVGSSSLHQSMLYSVPLPLFQTHSMNRSEPYFADDLLKRYDDESLGYPIHIRKAQKFIYHFQRHGRPFACITMIRDPIARGVSAFFQNIANYPELAVTENPPPVERYQEVFLNEWDHNFADRWFDHHLRDALGLDWFAQDFDPSAGHASAVHGDNSFLLMQLELSDDTKERVIREFLNFDGFVFDVQANVGDQKQYAEIYRAFRALPLPGDFLDRMCDSRVAQHFYTPQQTAEFRAKWEG
ncbi:MAG: putative capsular polysaccharide synthesis family protein [Planctomycetota bacterium]